jgi:hypothetical protein
MSKQSNQSRGSQSGGGQVVGKAPGGRLHQPPSTLLGTDGKSGQSQSTNRGKGGR